jgi:hypothetical protein
LGFRHGVVVGLISAADSANSEPAVFTKLRAKVALVKAIRMLVEDQADDSPTEEQLDRRVKLRQTVTSLLREHPDFIPEAAPVLKLNNLEFLIPTQDQPGDASK